MDQKNQNISKAEEGSTHFFKIVTIAEIPIHACKTSKECFKFLKALRNIPKIGPKILQRDMCRELFL